MISRRRHPGLARKLASIAAFVECTNHFSQNIMKRLVITAAWWVALCCPASASIVEPITAPKDEPEVRRALALARPRAGNNRAARIAMMAMTTSSSVSVNARLIISIAAPLIIISFWRIVSPRDFFAVKIHFDIAYVSIHEANHVLRIGKQRVLF